MTVALLCKLLSALGGVLTILATRVSNLCELGIRSTERYRLSHRVRERQWLQMRCGRLDTKGRHLSAVWDTATFSTILITLAASLRFYWLQLHFLRHNNLFVAKTESTVGKLYWVIQSVSKLSGHALCGIVPWDETNTIYPINMASTRLQKPLVAILCFHVLFLLKEL